MHCPVPSLLVVILMLFSHSAFSAPIAIDKSLPITIQSDTASFERITRYATHEGNVILTQGTHSLKADKLTIKKDKHGELSVITATGTPATFMGKLGPANQPVYAKAKIIYYYPDKQLIILEGAATVEHEKDKFEGPSLSYQLDKQVISASRKSGLRPTVTLHPRA